MKYARECLRDYPVVTSSEKKTVKLTMTVDTFKCLTIFIAVNTPIQSLFLFLFIFFMLGLIHLNIADSDEMSQNWHFV